MLNDENLYLFKFAWKSIRRNAGRSFFIGFSVSLAVVIAVWVVAFFDGLNSQIERAVVNTNTGFFQIQEPHYARSTDSSFPHEFDERMKDMIQRIGPKSFSPELVLDGNISTPEGAAGLMVLGIEPELHRNYMGVGKKIVEGSYLERSDTTSIVIGQELANLFKFKTGDQLVLNYQDVKGELRSEILIIKGIYHYSGRVFEKRFVYINQGTWQKIFMGQDSGGILFNRVGLKTKDLSSEPYIQEVFNNSEYKIKTWKNLNPEMAVVLDFHDGMIKFFFLIIAMTIIMTILTPVQMLWQERLKEMRMMNIIGVTVKKFWKLGVYEVVQMIFLSSFASGILLIIVIGIQSYTGVDFTYLNNGIAIERAGIKLPAIIYPDLSISQLVVTFAFVFFVLSISYIWAIHRTLRKLGSEA